MVSAATGHRRPSGPLFAKPCCAVRGTAPETEARRVKRARLRVEAASGIGRNCVPHPGTSLEARSGRW